MHEKQAPGPVGKLGSVTQKLRNGGTIPKGMLLGENLMN